MRSDGGMAPSKTPVLSLVYFGNIELDIRYCILQSLYELLGVLNGDSITPKLLKTLAPDPGIPGGRNQSGCYAAALASFPNLTIGVTHCGLWNEYPFPRFIFASGGVDSSILSLYRFFHDSSSREQALARIAKEVPKVIALASTVPVCDNPECYLSYHWTMTDFDRNRGLCHGCQDRFIDMFHQMTSHTVLD